MKNIIKTLGNKKRLEIATLAEQIYQIGFAEGQASTAEDAAGEQSNHETVKRIAEVGEFILITNSCTSRGQYKNGDTLEVVEVRFSGLSAKGVEVGILHEEYEVIQSETFEHEGKHLRKVDREACEGDYARFSKELADRTTDVTPGKFYKVEIRRGQLRFACDGATEAWYVLYGTFGRTTENVEVFEVIAHEVDEPTPLTANQQRAEVIQRAGE